MKVEGGRSTPRFASTAMVWAGVFVAGVVAAEWRAIDNAVESRVRGSRSSPLRAYTVSAAEGSGQWTLQSPVPFLVSGALVTTPATYNTYNSGRVSSIAVDPRDPLRWLVGVGNGGVWETRDAGGSWTPLTDDAPTLAIGAVAFAPSNPDIVYIATGENVATLVLLC